MRLPLVVGIDGSESSLPAVDWATDEAVRHGRPLRLVHASLWERYEDESPLEGVDGPDGGPGERTDGKALADHIVAVATQRVRARAPGVRLDSVVLPQDPVYALLHEGDNAAVLVTGCRGRGGLEGLLLGSVGLAVAGRAVGPVVVVRGDAEALAGTRGRVVLAAGEPGTGDTAARFALREAEARDGVLEVVRTWRRPARPMEHPLLTDRGQGGEEDARALVDDMLREPLRDHPDARVSRRVAEGPARKALLERSAAADLLVLGVRRRHVHEGLQLGRVAHTMLHHARCPVAVVPELP